MDDVLPLVARWDAGIEDRVCGADEAAIDALEELVGRALPTDYRRFLALMGEWTGGLVPGGDFRISTVASFYTALNQGRQGSDMSERRARFLFVGACVGGDGVHPDFYLDAAGDPPGCVYESETALSREHPFQRDGLVTAGDLRQLVVGESFYKLRVGRLPFRRSLMALGAGVDRRSRPERFARSQVCARHGLVEVMPGSLGWHAFDAEAAAVACYQPVGLGPYWTVAASSRPLAERLIAEMTVELHLVRSVPHPSDTLR